MFENPFTPNFGEVPLFAAGRRQVLSEFERAFNSERRKPELSMLISGARGTGKTALLSMIADIAQGSGWVAVNVASVTGMLEDCIEQLQHEAAGLLDADQAVHISSVAVGGVLEFELDSATDNGNWRTRFGGMLEALNSKDIGVLITVDEVNPDLDELVQLASVYQLFVRESRKVALVMAGLPFSVDALLQDKSVSFLRRAQRRDLGRIADEEVSESIAKTAEYGGKTIGDAALCRATRAADGFPFMAQLVGYRAWEFSGDDAVIEDAAVREGIEYAKRELKQQVLAATYRELSPGDIAFLEAMLADRGDSKTGDIAARLKQSASYVCQYRTRLLAAGVIGSRGRGVVGFDLPCMREYLIENGHGVPCDFDERRKAIREAMNNERPV